MVCLLCLSLTSFAQHRATRSDKGSTHHHSSPSSKLDSGALIVIGLVAVGVIIIAIIGIKNEKNKKVQREKEAKERVERIEKRRLTLIEKHGEDIGMKLFNQQFFLGMTKEQLIDSKGYNPGQTRN